VIRIAYEHRPIKSHLADVSENHGLVCPVEYLPARRRAMEHDVTLPPIVREEGGDGNQQAFVLKGLQYADTSQIAW